jgi:hypothetical protein
LLSGTGGIKKASGNAHSPKTTLEVLHQLQKHRVRVGAQTLFDRKNQPDTA